MAGEESAPAVEERDEKAAAAAEAAEEVNDNKKKKKKSSKGGVLVRLWRGIFGGMRSEDYEKRLQYLSKEEASVHARIKRRAQSSRRMVRNLIALSVVSEVVAVVYAIVTTRSIDLDWQMRAVRVLPMFVLPGIFTVIYSALIRFTRMLDRKDQKTLEKLQAERKAKIDELKERTNYYRTQQLIQKYDLDPTAKAAAATVLASKLGADSGLKVYVGDESKIDTSSVRSSDAELTHSNAGLRNRKQSHAGGNNSMGSTTVVQNTEGLGLGLGQDGGVGEVSVHGPKVVEHYKGPGVNDGGWIAKIAALLVGEDPSQSYALICGNCHMHNGLARKEDYPHITYYCPHCNALNMSGQTVEQESVTPSGKTVPVTPVEGKLVAESEVVSSNATLITQELSDKDQKEESKENEAS